MKRIDKDELDCIYLRGLILNKIQFINDNFDKIVKSNVNEGKRVGKNPWCCDSRIECASYEILNRSGSYLQENADETIARRKLENG